MRHALLIIQVLFSVLFLVIVFHDFDMKEFEVLIIKVPIWFVISLFLSILTQFLYVLRWDVLLKLMGVEVSYWSLLKSTLMGLFFANFAPATFGQDATKIYYVGKHKGYFDIGVSVLIDKFLGFFAMILWATLFLWWFNFSDPVFNTTKHILTLVLIAFVVTFFVAWLPFEKFFHPFEHRPRIAFLVDKIERLLTHVRMAGSNFKMLMVSIVIIAIIFVINTFIYLEFFSITLQSELGFFQTMSILLVIIIVTNLPVSVNGIGVREQLHFLYFAALGIPKEAAVGISVLIFTHLLIISLIGYVLWLNRKKI